MIYQVVFILLNHLSHRFVSPYVLVSRSIHRAIDYGGNFL